jgi:Tol biopolymer transport system component
MGAALLLALGAAAGYALRPSARANAEVVRFRVPTPDGSQLNVLGVVGNAFAISPDGKWLALVARPARSDAAQIYLRRLDRLEETVVAGGSGGDSPFFSPDSRELGFIGSDGRLRRVAIDGGAVSTISPRAADPRSQPAWADDGQIYFRGMDFRMYAVSEAGGEPRALLDEELTLSTAGGALPSVLSFPVPLPGGKHILLSECVAGILRGNGNCNGRLLLMNVATRERTPLDVPASRGLYVPGYLLLLDDAGQLSAVEFDVESGKVRGDPAALLDGLGDAILQRAQVAVSQSGTLVYLDGEEVADRVVVEVDRRGVERVVIAKPGKYLWPRISPDRTRILMLQGGVRSGAQLAVYDKRLGAVTPLTFEGANQRASWSPDGRRIAFSSTRDSLTDVWIIPSDGSAAARPIARGKDVQQHTATSWTPDGRWIVIDGLADDGPNVGADDLYALSVDGDSALRPLVATPANEQSGEVSPDGRILAYVSDDAGVPQVYIQYYGRPSGRWIVSEGAAIEPVWTSSSELVYTSLESDSVIAAQLSENVGVTRRALFPRSRFTAGSTSWREFDVSRDGQTFVFTRSVERTRPREPIVVVNWIEEVRAAFAARRGVP